MRPPSDRTDRVGPTAGRPPAPLLGLSLVLALALGLIVSCGADDEGSAAADGDVTSAADDATDVTVEATDGSAGGEGTEGGEGNPAADEQPVDEEAADGSVDDELFPDVVGATATLAADGSWTFSATLSSPYDTAERYADAWRVVGPDGEVYGIRELAHDHAGEQPFTRSQSGIVIPADVGVVTVEGRDQVSGWGGATVEVELGS